MSKDHPQKPSQPEGHDSKCPCAKCENWAEALLDWEQEMVARGLNPWARVVI